MVVETGGTRAWTAADERARDVEQQMTDDERFSLLVSVMGTNHVVLERDARIPEGTTMSAGYTPGVPRLGVPQQQSSDASLGVTNPGYREGDTATALPAGIALGASFNPALARRWGEPSPRFAERSKFRVSVRRPTRVGCAWSRNDQWHPVRRCDLDDQTLL